MHLINDSFANVHSCQNSLPVKNTSFEGDTEITCSAGSCVLCNDTIYMICDCGHFLVIFSLTCDTHYWFAFLNKIFMPMSESYLMILLC